jgi:four helix bundle protein
MENITNYKDLLVWQKAHILALTVYKLTRTFPLDERFGLVQQIRRSASSVPTNIVEGFGRFSRKEYIQFLYVSRASLIETEYHLFLSKDLGYIKQEVYESLKVMTDEIGRMNNGLIKALKARGSG